MYIHFQTDSSYYDEEIDSSLCDTAAKVNSKRTTFLDFDFTVTNPFVGIIIQRINY